MTGLALGGALAPLAGGLAYAQGGGTTLRIGYQKHGNFVILKDRGTLEKRLASQGVRVQWLEFPAGPQLLEGLNAGAVDVGTVGETPPIFAQASGVDFIYIASESPAPRSEAIVVQQGSPIRSVAQLRGKKVQPITDATLAYQQQIADRFSTLRLIPGKLTVADARWKTG